jgi:hypothetical protein
VYAAILPFLEEEQRLLGTRSSRVSSRSGSSRSGSSRSGFLCFLGFFGFLDRFFHFLLFNSRSSGAGSRSGGSRSGGISSKNNSREGEGYESGNDGGENFFHLNYLRGD